MTTVEPICYRVSDGSDDCFTSHVCRTAPGGKWYIWLPIEDSINEKVLFDNAEEAIAAAVRKHDEERARL